MSSALAPTRKAAALQRRVFLSCLAHGPKYRRGAILPGLVATIAVVAVLVGGFLYWRSSGQTSQTGALLVPVVKEPFTLDVTEKGELESSGSAEVRCEVKSAGGSGTAILKIVPEGTNVKAGDFLVQLDSSRLDSEKTAQQIAVNTSKALVVQAQAVYETALIAKREYLEGTFTQEQQTLQSEKFIAEENLRRAQQYLLYSRRLAASGYITQLQLDADSFAVENAKNSLGSSQNKLRVLQEFTKAKMLKQLESDIASNEAKWEAEKKSYELEVSKLTEIEDQIAKCVLTAPNAGQVKYAHKVDGRGNAEFMIEEGAIVREGQVIIRLPDAERMRVKVNVNESLLKSLREGMSASIRSVSLDDTVLLGKVEKINQYSEPSSFRRGDVKEFATFVKVVQPDRRLLPGMSAEVTIHCLALPSVLQVPVQAIYAHGEEHYCFVKDGAKLAARPVKVGPDNETFVVIESGLAAGEEVAINPKSHLKEVNLPELSAVDSQQVIQKRRKSPDAEVSDKLPPPQDRSSEESGAGPVRGGEGERGGGGDPSARMMGRFDSNGDGFITSEELPGPLQEHFGTLDSNSDGKVDRGELSAGLAKLRAAGFGPPGGGGGPPGGDGAGAAP